MNGETKFNMAMLFYIRINKLLEAKDIARMEGSMYHWFNCLSAVFDNVFFKIGKEEKKNILEELDKAEKMLSSSSSWASSQAQFNFLKSTKARKLLTGIDRSLMIAMDKKSMIFPNIKLQGIEQLKQRYGLEVKDGKT